MPPSAPSLQIAVLGAGKIGSAFAFQLARQGGHDVTVIARPGSERLRQLERDQAIVDVDGDRASVRVADALDETTPYDLLIVTLLAHQTDALLPALARSRAGCVQFMFNTFRPERLQEAIGPEHGPQQPSLELSAEHRIAAVDRPLRVAQQVGQAHLPSLGMAAR